MTTDNHEPAKPYTVPFIIELHAGVGSPPAPEFQTDCAGLTHSKWSSSTGLFLKSHSAR